MVKRKNPSTKGKEKRDRKKYRDVDTSPDGIQNTPWPTRYVANAVCVDEVGRGALMGPMCIGACYIHEGFDPRGVHDSKLLKEHEREAIYERVKNDPKVTWHVEFVWQGEIDEYHLGEAWHRGIQRAVHTIRTQVPNVETLVMDGNNAPRVDLPCVCEPKADSTFVGVALAAVMAKVTRDRYMVEHSNDFGPDFKEIMASGKGYAHSKRHLELIRSGKATPMHRKSFGTYRISLIRKVNLPKQ